VNVFSGRIRCRVSIKGVLGYENFLMAGGRGRGVTKAGSGRDCGEEQGKPPRNVGLLNHGKKRGVTINRGKKK